MYSIFYHEQKNDSSKNGWKEKADVHVRTQRKNVDETVNWRKEYPCSTEISSVKHKNK